MAYCTKCGAEIDNEAVICPKCGVPQPGKQAHVASNSKDVGGFGWGLLGFCVPIIGLILYLVWKDTQPLNGKAAGKGALIGFIVSIVSSIIYYIVFLSMLSQAGYY